MSSHRVRSLFFCFLQGSAWITHTVYFTPCLHTVHPHYFIVRVNPLFSCFYRAPPGQLPDSVYTMSFTPCLHTVYAHYFLVCCRAPPGQLPDNVYTIHRVFTPCMPTIFLLFAGLRLASCRITCASSIWGLAGWRRRVPIHPPPLSLQDIVSLQSFIVRVNHPFIAPPPLAKLTLLHYYCTTIAQYTPPHRPAFVRHTPYNMVLAILSCKGQNSALPQGVAINPSINQSSHTDRATHEHKRSHITASTTQAENYASRSDAGLGGSEQIAQA